MVCYMVVEAFLVEENVMFLLHVSCGVRGMRTMGRYFVIFLEELRGFCCRFFRWGLVLHNAGAVEGQMDLRWCSHVVVAFV